MDTETLIRHWALLAAAVPGAIVVFAVLRALFRRSRGGRLRHALANRRAAKKALASARKRVQKLERKLAKLQARSRSVSPRILRETEEALVDQEVLAKTLGDKLEVTVNHVRRAIFEEYPPDRHEKLRARHLRQDIEDGRPFGF